MKLPNYVRVESDCVIVCCYMHVLHEVNQVSIDESFRSKIEEFFKMEIIAKMPVLSVWSRCINLN